MWQLGLPLSLSSTASSVGCRPQRSCMGIPVEGARYLPTSRLSWVSLAEPGQPVREKFFHPRHAGEPRRECMPRLFVFGSRNLMDAIPVVQVSPVTKLDATQVPLELESIHCKEAVRATYVTRLVRCV